MSPDQFRRQAIARKAGEGHDHGETRLRRRMRELKANLVRDVMHAISVASADELGDLIPAAHEHHNGASQTPIESPNPRERRLLVRPASKSRGGWVKLAEDVANEGDASLPPPPNDPFAITSPGELLASTDESSTRPAAVLDRPTRTPSILEDPRPAESVTSLVDGDKEASSERRPKVVLREGERLLSATGSGSVIRRERRVAPPR